MKKISDFCITASGGTPLKSKPEYYENGSVPWLLSGEVSSRNIHKTKKFITKLGLENSSAKLFPPGTVLIAMYGATAGQVGVLRTEAATNQAVCGIYPNDEVLSDYLYYFFLTKKDFLVAQAVGNAQPNISQQKIKNIEIDLPCIEEQKRIVATLDEAFADIDKARVLTERNLENARELFASYLTQIFNRTEISAEKVALGKASGGVLTGPFGSLLHKSDYIDSGVPLINPAHITATGIAPDNKKTVSQETKERLKSYVLSTGDIVIGRRGEMGRCATVTQKEDGFLCGTGSFFIKSSENIYSPYVVRFLRSNIGKSKLEKLAGGAVMPNLSNSQLSKLEIPLPSLDEQRKIADKIDTLSENVEKVFRTYRQKSLKLEELKKSLLQKAFTGELTRAAS